VILVCILVNIGMVVSQAVIPSELRLILAGGFLLTAVVSSVFVFMLAIKVFGTGLGVVLGILTLVPCLGLIALLIVNGKATSVLKERGYSVGFLGADLSQF